MTHFPSTRAPARISALSAQLEHESAPRLPQRSRAFWFVLGFFTALTFAGFVAGLLP